jgi:hypothetical protein
VCSIEVHFEGIGGSAGFGIPGANVRMTAGISLAASISCLDIRKKKTAMTSTKENLGMSSSAIVGTGVIGASWAAYYLARGLMSRACITQYTQRFTTRSGGAQLQITPVMPSLIKKSIV